MNASIGLRLSRSVFLFRRASTFTGMLALGALTSVPIMAAPKKMERTVTFEEVSLAAAKSMTTLEITLLHIDDSCDPVSSRTRREFEMFDAYMGHLESYFAKSFVHTDISLIANYRLTIADHALKAHCLNLADNQYRQALSVYSGTAYSGLRDRARIGIEDVREQRRESRIVVPRELVGEWLEHTLDTLDPKGSCEPNSPSQIGPRRLGSNGSMRRTSGGLSSLCVLKVASDFTPIAQQWQKDHPDKAAPYPLVPSSDATNLRWVVTSVCGQSAPSTEIWTYGGGRHPMLSTYAILDGRLNQTGIYSRCN